MASLIRPEDLLPVAEYERVRAERRAAIIRARERRRVEIGPWLSVVFENRDSVLYQIQEMIRIERLTEPDKVRFEIDTYSELLPGPGELSGTLFVEIMNEDERRRALPGLVGIERALRLRAGGAVSAGQDKRPIDAAVARPQAACVYYLRFALPPALCDALRVAAEPVWLAAEHPRYGHAARLAPALVAELAREI